MCERNVILINRRKLFKDAFTNNRVYLYLPVDVEGNVVCPTVAKKLECWRSLGEKIHDTLPEVFKDSRAGISNALLWQQSGHELGQLTRSIAFGSMKRFNDWLYTLERVEDNDIHYSGVYYADPN